MEEITKDSTTDVVVIGAGISGLVTAKCLRDSGFDVVVLERTGDVGGLWTYRESEYGVTSFTHINVSKHNYSFSDFPFPDDVPDFPHHSDMAAYVKNYVKHNDLYEVINFHHEVKTLNRKENKDFEWEVTAIKVKEDDKGQISQTSEEKVFRAKFIAIASGHHAKPTWPNFNGQDTFTGTKMHAVSFKDTRYNKLEDKKVVVVGVGNSAVDTVVNLADVGMKKPVYLSTRSGAWVVPNYVFGHPVDHYANRLFFKLPWRIATVILEAVIKLINGNPYQWNLNPKMHALQTQPTVSRTLIHHIQRGNVKVVENIQRIDGERVYFKDGVMTEPDCLVFCTGYKIDLPFLSEDVRKKVLDEKTNRIRLYKNVFASEIGPSLAFIGFVQPASGGILTMSEIQARWFAELCRDKIFLPSKAAMEEDIDKEMEQNIKRYYSSGRHTIQRDPIMYNDEIASYFGAKPELKKHPGLAWRLLLGSGGAAQWRLQGPGRWPGAEQTVRKVPVPVFWIYSLLIVIIVLFMLVWHVMDEVCDWFDD